MICHNTLSQLFSNQAKHKNGNFGTNCVGKRSTDRFEEEGGEAGLPGIIADAKHMPIHDI